MTSVLQEIVSILVGGVQSMAQGIAQGLNAMASGLFVSGAGTTESPYTLTVFGGIVAIFAGIALRLLVLPLLSQSGLCHLVEETNILGAYRKVCTFFYGVSIMEQVKSSRP